jgi:hypothetical protein
MYQPRQSHRPIRAGSLLSDLQGRDAAVVADEYSVDRATALNLVRESLEAELLCVLRYHRHHTMIAQYLGSDDAATRHLVEDILTAEKEAAELISNLAAQLKTQLINAESVHA